MALDALALEIQIRSAAQNQQVLSALTNTIKQFAEQSKQSFDGLQGAVRDMSQTLEQDLGHRALSEAQKATALMNINLRDLGATFVIQSQKIRQALQEMQEGFFDFETASQQVKVVGELTAEQQAQIEDASVAIARAYNLSATDVIKAFREMIARGVEFADAQRIVEDAAKGGAAGLATIEEASTGAITVIRQFGLRMDESNNIMAKMVFIANESGATVADLASSLSIAGSQAAQMGFSFEETAAAIAFLRDAGLDASSAGTALRQFLIRIQDPTSEARAKLEELGIELEDADGNFKSLTDIMREVEAATADLGVVERAQITAMLFEVRGQQLLNITRSRSIEDLEAMIESTSQFNNEQRATEFLNEKAAEATDTWAAKMNSANERLEDARRGLAEGFVPAQLVATNATANFLELLNSLDPAIRAPISSLVVMGGELLGLAGQLALLAANLKSIMPQIINFTKHLTIARLSAIAAGLAVGGIITSFMALQEQDQGTRNVLIGLTALQFGLAGAAAGAAIAQNAAASAWLGPGLAAYLPIITGILLGAIATAVLLAAAPPKGAAHGAMVPSAPGTGSLFRVGEGIDTEIISPVPMMRETVREVIRAEGGAASIVINPTLVQSEFGKIDDEAIRMFNESSAKAFMRELKKRGVVLR